MRGMAKFCIRPADNQRFLIRNTLIINHLNLVYLTINLLVYLHICEFISTFAYREMGDLTNQQTPNVEPIKNKEK